MGSIYCSKHFKHQQVVSSIFLMSSLYFTNDFFHNFDFLTVLKKTSLIKMSTASSNTKKESPHKVIQNPPLPLPIALLKFELFLLCLQLRNVKQQNIEIFKIFLTCLEKWILEFLEDSTHIHTLSTFLVKFRERKSHFAMQILGSQWVRAHHVRVVFPENDQTTIPGHNFILQISKCVLKSNNRSLQQRILECKCIKV